MITYLKSADLQGANLRDAELMDAVLEGANLRGVNLTNSYLEEVADIFGNTVIPDGSVRN